MSEFPLVAPVGLDTVVEPRPGLLARLIDDEMILAPEDGSQIWLLDAASAATWTSYDGRRSLSEIVDELTRHDSTPRATLEAAVVAITRRYAAMGLFVTSAEPHASDSTPGPLTTPVTVSDRPDRTDRLDPFEARGTPAPDT